MGRPWRVTETFRIVPCREFQQSFQGTSGRVYAGMRIAQLFKATGNGQDGEIAWLTVRNLLPKKGSGYARIRERTHRIR